MEEKNHTSEEEIICLGGKADIRNQPNQGLIKVLTSTSTSAYSQTFTRRYSSIISNNMRDRTRRVTLTV